ncbi:MAG: hypothetical protein VYC56_07690 [Actinomycetota bacterium]|nr:hypothetical protein [Actinomycetota bacterium]MEE2957749.1 hypothetical protein [Actinomycetota bacterium]
MSEFPDDDPGSGGSGSGRHCDACNEWMEPSDTHCPCCGSAR